MRKKGAFTIMEVLVVAGIFVMMALFLAPIVRMVRERAQTIACANNLREINLGLQLYASDHGGNFAPNLGALYPAYVKNRKAFDCPAGKRTGTPEDPDYGYTAGLTESSGMGEAVAYDIDGNHGKARKNILRMDGSVEWVADTGAKGR
jgi:type II secretory pathway pseudopilin PulG